jgi:hypothetical protein
VTHGRAKFWLRIIGSLLIVLAFAGAYIESTTAPELIQGDGGKNQSMVRAYQIITMVSYVTLVFIIATGILLLKLNPFGSYCFIITSISALLICSLPFLFFLAPGFSSMPVLLSVSLEDISGYAVVGLVPFVVSLLPFWGPPFTFLCYRSLRADNNLNEDDENDKTFNNGIEAGQ